MAVLTSAPAATDSGKPWLKLLLTSSLLVALAGCSSVAMVGNGNNADSADLPTISDGQLARLDEGSHHPAVQALLQRAEAARQQGNWSKVMSYLDQARQIQPRNAAIYYRQGWANLQMHQPAAAEQLLQRGLLYSQDDQLSNRIRALLADAMEQQGRLQDARQMRAQMRGAS
ncbi:tetratricopeptide repeat protein [Oceanobacter mangrovi]|uniref:tetratricopeptide repeat protein n=1 Tax=Oceanobacter mangrovi TaxID=2862510 RepID=UPI001C8DCD37|nr:tetratricopeptide repeat protein [Oceanobacter mangrovi]